MHQSPGSDPQHGRSETGRGSDPSKKPLNETDAQQEWEERKRDPALRNGSGQQQTMSQSVIGFVEEHPVVAAAGALAVGAVIALAWRSRSNYNNRYDRRAARAAQQIERTFAREMRALRHSDMANRVGQFGSSIGDALSRIDLSPLAERGKSYLEAARNRLNV